MQQVLKASDKCSIHSDLKGEKRNVRDGEHDESFGIKLLAD